MLLTQDEAEYHADVGRMSNSLVEAWLRDRWEFKRLAVDRQPWGKPSEWMVLGSYFETLLFDPDSDAHDLYVVEPTRGMIDSSIPANSPEAMKAVDKRTKEGKAAYKAFVEASRGRQVIKPEHAMAAACMVDAVASHPEAAALCFPGKGHDQAVIHWDDPSTGLACKARYDRAFADENLIVELKTTRNVHPDRGVFDWMRRGYHRKAAMYLDAWRSVFDRNARLAFVMVENHYPYRCAVLWCDVDSPAVEIGRTGIERTTGYQHALREIHQAIQANDYSYPWEREGQPFRLSEFVERAEANSDEIMGATQYG